MKKPEHCLEFTSRDQWRNWLYENHVKETEAWIIITKKKQLIYWLHSAKREETKEKRIQKIIEDLAGE